ncbi:MAG TPA: amidohydrolase [Pyrinomonadaceae bacterium]|nr:amidohydrolase [Pyrinomonadaceae bacterium]
MRKRIAVFIILLVLALLTFNATGTGAQSRKRVSLLILHGKIFTGDARGTVAQAVAVNNDRIIAVGSDAEIMSHYRSARVIDLNGKFMTAGFNDAHLHFMNGGFSLMRVDLNGSRTLDEALQRIAAKARELPAGAWILGRGWDHTLWGGRWPTRQDLDRVAPNNPVFVQRVDGHVSWVNSLALQKAGITRETQQPAGGEIMRDSTGEPAGILKETAAALVGRVVPEPTQAEKMQAIERALMEARRYGITSIQDNSGYTTTQLYRQLNLQGKLTVRVSEWQNFEDSVDELKRQREEFNSIVNKTFGGVDPLMLKLGVVKGYVDGTLGSRTAAMLAPYADDPANSGIPRHTPEDLTRMIVERAQAGFQIALHCIGDRANRMALDGFEAARFHLLELRAGASIPHQARTPTPTPSVATTSSPQTNASNLYLRHRIEHAQVVAPADFPRFRDLGVIASMQPSHAISDKRWAQARLGEARAEGAYAWHTMMSLGVHVPFGTDWPVEPINPYLGLYAAVTRQSTDGQPAGGWFPQQRISIEDAIRNYTAESAYASFDENLKGQIKPGMLADFTVHSQDLLTIRPEDIFKTETMITILGGRVVYQRVE